ncbi:facilitated trehalose transporter Tret1-like [Sitodiplosis mosellana]|uniref:facilitated trehalose transporter Tret1-like n=1 Tax=Sitodiplosis mosellana TaxID=263140 RepID=UPI002443C627|nr:facilitated trehalose transporter Tret1-like [Sitodiplosis mosellana]
MTYLKNEGKNQNKEKDYKCRQTLSQLLATTAATLLFFDIGLCITFPFIVIAALTGFHNRHNVNETLSFTPIEASWLASIQPISGAAGSILSAVCTDKYGRKTCMLIVNIPLFIAWYLMYSASSVWQVFFANILLGLSAGLTESTIINYVSEICQPKIRGMMMIYTYIGYDVAIIMVATLNTQMSWRLVSMVFMFIPIITAVALFFIPETPLWLLSKNRTADAERSLRCLRGWVPKEALAHELQEMQRYSRRFKSCDACIKKDLTCTHPPPTLGQKFIELKRKQTLKPLFVVMALFVITSFSNTFLMPTYIVQISTAYHLPLDSDHFAAVLSYAYLLADISSISLIRFTGKRNLYLAMLSILFLCAVTICAYGFVVLPSGYSSYPHVTPNFKLPNKQLGYIPFACIILASYAIYCAVNTIPWQMMSELFPYKIRGTATGIAAALSYVLVFIATKSFHSMDTTLSLPGVALFNSIVIFVGLILMYKILPETENRTLEDIEMHFADKSKKITDRKIDKRDSRQREHGNDSGRVAPKRVTIVEIDERHDKKNENSYDNCGFARI